FWSERGRRACHDAGPWGEVIAAYSLLTRDEQRARPVVQRRGVSGSDDRTASDDRAKACEHLERSVRPGPLIDRDGCVAATAEIDFDGHNFVHKVPSIDRSDSAPMAFIGERVGIFS